MWFVLRPEFETLVVGDAVKCVYPKDLRSKKWSLLTCVRSSEVTFDTKAEKESQNFGCCLSDDY